MERSGLAKFPPASRNKFYNQLIQFSQHPLAELTIQRERKNVGLNVEVNVAD